MLNWQEILQATATLFFIMDPIGNLPIFTAILNKQSPKEQSKIICRELIFALLILLVFLYACILDGFPNWTKARLELQKRKITHFFFANFLGLNSFFGAV